jgi:uncharacterized membrane protein
MWRHRITLIAIVLVAAALRWAWLDAAVLSRDEGSSWRVSRYEPLELLRHCAANVHAPLSFLLLKAWTNVVGDSVFAMRSLSALYGVLCVPLIYFVVLEAGRLPGRQPGPPTVPETRSHQWGGLVAACAIALHPLQLEVSRTARMYSLGALLVLVTSFLLLRSLSDAAATTRASIVWILYGVCAAALAYTHNYGLLALGAQAMFACGYMFVHRRQFLRTRPGVLGPCLAGGLAIVLYSPWLPVLQAQTTEVSQGYWIPPLTFDQLARDFETWTVGNWSLWLPAGLLVLIFAAALMGVAVFGRAAAWLLFALIAFLPWLAAIVFYILSGNSVLQLRYLAFAQAGLFALSGVAVALKRFQRASFVVAVLWLSIVGVSAVQVVFALPPARPAFPEMAAWLASQHRAGDVVIVDDFRDLTRVQYYLMRAGVQPLDIRAEFSLFGRAGHTVHIGSVTANNLVYNWETLHLEAMRLWHIDMRGIAPLRGENWRLAARHDFPGNPALALRNFDAETNDDESIR